MSSNLADLPPSTDIWWSRWVQIWQIYPWICWQICPLGLTSCGQDEFKFGRSTPRSGGRSTPRLASSGWIWQIYPSYASRCTPQYLHPVVKMSSNLADLPLDLLADLSPAWHLVAKFGRSTLDLPADVPPYSHLVAKNGNFRFLLPQLI